MQHKPEGVNGSEKSKISRKDNRRKLKKEIFQFPLHFYQLHTANAEMINKHVF